MSLELAEVIDDPLAVVAIEWGGIVENVLPEQRLSVTLERTGENVRKIRFEYPDTLSYLLEGTK